MSGEQTCATWRLGHRIYDASHMFIATLAIAGIFPFAGFFSKDAILWETWSREGGLPLLWYIGFATALMTAFLHVSG